MKSVVTFAIVRDQATCDPVVTAAWLSGPFAAALETYLSRDVAPAHGLAAPAVDPTVYASVAEAPKGAYVLVFQGPLSGMAPGVLAYHMEDGDGRVSAPILTTGLALDQISVSATHEAAEADANPSTNRWADLPLAADGSDGGEQAFELCDRCEEWSYAIDSVMVSDFLLPAAFDPNAADGTKLDFLGHLKQGGPIRGDLSYVILRKAGVESTDPPAVLGQKHSSSRCRAVVRASVPAAPPLGRWAKRRKMREARQAAARARYRKSHGGAS